MQHKLSPITPQHADGTPCTHRVSPSGRPLDHRDGCPGRAQYATSCSCGWQNTFAVKASVTYARDRHRDEALTAAGRPK